MSYDTTVRDALDPPESRIRDDVARPRLASVALRRLTARWRPLAATVLSLGTLCFVTWVVAVLTTPNSAEPIDSPDVEVSPIVLEQPNERSID